MTKLEQAISRQLAAQKSKPAAKIVRREVRDMVELSARCGSLGFAELVRAMEGVCLHR